MNQYLISYCLVSRQKELSGADATPVDSLDIAFEIFDVLSVGDYLFVTIKPSGNRLIISASEEGIDIELDYLIGGYLGKTMTRDEAREVLNDSELYFKNPELYGFEELPHS